VNNPIKMFFSEIEDPRKGSNVLYPLEEILLVAIITFLIRGEGFEDMEDVGEYWLEELRKYYPYKRGTPSADTFRYVFMSLDPRKFGDCFAQWMKHVHATIAGVIAIDGKSSCGSGRGVSPISTVSAYCHERGVVMASIDTEDKSNEITVLPKLLEMLNLNNAVVTIDAMGCQKAVVGQVAKQKGDYLISLKGNQGRLHDQTKGFFEAILEDYPELKAIGKDISMDVYEYEQVSNGRHYRRRIAATSEFCPGLSPFRKEWKKLKSVVMIESWRTCKGKTSFERRFAITSLEANAITLSEIIRNHWSVENNLHWMLDVCFQDDACTIRERTAAKNITILKRMAFNILKEHRKTTLKKKSIRRMRLTAGMSPESIHAMIKTAATMSLE
jgi:predicted transposase YbfD/YdcC